MAKITKEKLSPGFKRNLISNDFSAAEIAKIGANKEGKYVKLVAALEGEMCETCRRRKATH